MCSPALIPVAASAIIAGASAYSKSKSASDAATVNAGLAEQKRAHTLQMGVLKASRIGAEVRRSQSTALSMAGASGVDTASGTADNLLDVSGVNGAMDMEQVKANAAMGAWGFEAEEADWWRRREAAEAEGVIGIGGAALGAIGGGASALTKG